MNTMCRSELAEYPSAAEQFDPYYFNGKGRMFFSFLLNRPIIYNKLQEKLKLEGFFTLVLLKS